MHGPYIFFTKFIKFSFVYIGGGGNVNKTGGISSSIIDKLANITILGDDNNHRIQNIMGKIFINIINVTTDAVTLL